MAHSKHFFMWATVGATHQDEGHRLLDPLQHALLGQVVSAVVCKEETKA